MRALGEEASHESRVYFTGGVSAVLMGWRLTTIDLDMEIVPERDELLRALPALKERLEINVELVSPSHFIPPVPGWAERSPFITREGLVAFHHYDFYAQALAKIERGHEQDQSDVAAMLSQRLVEPDRLRSLYEAITPELYRYPAIDPESLRRAVERTIQENA